MNLKREELAKLNLLKKGFPHQCHHWKSLESMTSRRSSEVFQSIWPPNGICKICKIRKRWLKWCDSAPSSPVFWSTPGSFDLFRSCWQPSKNYRGGSVKGYGNLSSNSKPQNNEWKSPTLGHIFMWPSGNLPNRKNSTESFMSLTPKNARKLRLAIPLEVVNLATKHEV